jgi:hypothetical protein
LEPCEKVFPRIRKGIIIDEKDILVKEKESHYQQQHHHQQQEHELDDGEKYSV